MRRTTLITTLAALSLAVAGAAFAKGGPDGPGPDDRGGPGRHGGPFMHELRDLDLSDAQKTQIKGFFDARRDDRKADFKALHDLHRSYELATPGSAEFNQLTSQLADAESQQARERVTGMAQLRTQVYGVLTPAQRTQLATELANRPEPPAPPEPPQDR